MTQQVLVVNLNGPYIIKVQEFTTSESAGSTCGPAVTYRNDGASYTLYPGQYKEITVHKGKSFEVIEVGPVK